MPALEALDSTSTRRDWDRWGIRLRERLGFQARAEDVPAIFDNISYWASQQRMLVRPMKKLFENLRFVAEIYGLARRAAAARIETLLETYALDQMAGRRAGRMSGGQRQRLALAAATIHGPDLLFLDEPTSAVDPENRRDFWEHLFDLIDAVAREHGKGRRLFVQTTNLDSQRPVIWDMGAIAGYRSAEARELFRRVLLASASVQEVMDLALVAHLSAIEARNSGLIFFNAKDLPQDLSPATADRIYVSHLLRRL